MVTELAILHIKSDHGEVFEAAFASVVPFLTKAGGYRCHRLIAVLDRPDVYLLEVEWRDLAAHVEQFEPSDAHASFMAALEPYFSDEPFVIHVPANVPERG